MSNVDEKSTWSVQTKANWADSWTTIDYLHPLTLVNRVGPGIGEATFLYRFSGEGIKQADQSTFGAVEPLEDIANNYIRIRTEYDSEGEETSFIGIIVDEKTRLLSNLSLAGDQSITAFSIAYVLEKATINTARVLESCSESSSCDQSHSSAAVGEIQWVPPINEKTKRGKTLFGNRSSCPGPGNVYVYGGPDAQDEWSNLDIIKYLLKYYVPSVIQFNLTGQTEPLEQIKKVFNFSGVSVWNALNQLISKEEGLGFYLDIDEGTDEINIRVFTLTEVDITTSIYTLPANDRQETLVLPSAFPFTHIRGDVNFRLTNITQYDKIEVRGNRIKVLAPFSYSDTTLQEGWDTSEDAGSLEQQYKEGGDDPDPQVKDDFRRTDKFKTVFTHHIVPNDPCWNGEVRDGEGNGGVNAWFTANPNGTIDTTTPSVFWFGQKRFFREIPLEVGKDYTQEDLANENPPGYEPDYRPMAALVKDDFQGDEGTPTNRWYYVDNIHDKGLADDPRDNSHVRPLDKIMGIEISPPINHHYAAVAAVLDGMATNQPRVLSYTSLLAIAAFELDQRLRIVVDLTDTPHETIRKRVIDFENIEYWRATEDCPVDIGKDGELVRIHANNLVLRDDTAKLEAIATFIKAWYSVRRQAIQLPIKRVKNWVELGTLLLGVEGVQIQVDVNTVVTAVSMDFRSGMTTLETGYNADDFIAPNIPRIKGIG